MEGWDPNRFQLVTCWPSVLVGTRSVWAELSQAPRLGSLRGRGAMTADLGGKEPDGESLKATGTVISHVWLGFFRIDLPVSLTS